MKLRQLGEEHAQVFMEDGLPVLEMTVLPPQSVLDAYEKVLAR